MRFNEVIFTWSDIWRVLVRKKREIFRAGLIAFALSLFFLLVRPTEYQAEATFKEGVERVGVELSLKELMGMSLRSEPQFSFVLRSNQVLKPLVERLGTQLEVQQGGALSHLYQKTRDNLLREIGAKVSDVDPFSFQDAYYEKEKKGSFWLRFEDATHFTVYDRKKREVGRGKIGAPFFSPTLSFTLVQAPKRLPVDQWFHVIVRPWSAAVRQIRSKLVVETEKQNKSIYSLKFKNRDRYFATQVLNSLLEEYASFLKKDHDQPITSKPLDLAIVPSQPAPPRVLILSLFGGTAGAIGWSIALLFLTALRGFPASKEKLEAMGITLLGEVESAYDGIETEEVKGKTLPSFRKMVDGFKEKRVISLILGKGPDYSYALAQYLVRYQIRSLVIQCSFQKDTQGPGLLQICQGEKGVINKGEGYDWILPGGSTPYGVELLHSKYFSSFLNEMKSQYEKIFLVFRESLDSLEAQMGAKWGEQTILTVKDECNQELTPWAFSSYHEGNQWIINLT